MLAFVHIEKTAGMTMNWVLRRSFGLRHCDVHPWRKGADFFSADDYLGIQRLYPKIMSISGHDVKPYSDLEQVCPSVQYHTFLREPLARCASHYQYQIQVMRKRLCFEDWIVNERYRDWQTKKISASGDVHDAIQALQKRFFFVGLSERFDESLIILRTRSTRLRFNILHNSRNVASENNIKNRVLNDPQTRALLIEANLKDAVLYKFVVEELYARQVREYGKTLAADVAAFRRENHASLMDWKLISNFLKRRLVYKPILFCYQRCRRA
jgi:hypothetical protein